MKQLNQTITTYSKFMKLDNGNVLTVIMTTKKVFDIIKQLDLDIYTLNIGQDSFFIHGNYSGNDFDFDNPFDFVHYFGNIMRERNKKIQAVMYKMNVQYPFSLKGGYTFFAGRGFTKEAHQITFSVEGNNDDIYAYVEFEWGGKLDCYRQINFNKSDFAYSHTEMGEKYNRTILIMKMSKGHPFDYIVLS